MNASSIEWTDMTWNPVSGCSHVSEGCRNCYAERFFPRVYGTERVPIVKNSIRTLDPANFDEFNSRMRSRKFTDVQCHPERLDQPLRKKKPHRIFVNSMSDLFHEDVPDEFIGKVFGQMAQARQHIFQVLTKRPTRMQALLSNPPLCFQVGMIAGTMLPNVWLGVSVEDQKTANERIPILLQTPAAVRWVSAEPLLGPIDLTDIVVPDPRHAAEDHIDALFCDVEPEDDEFGGTTIDWVVVGGESGPKARPMHPEWARSIRDQCQGAVVPFFFKQWGEYLPVGQVLPGYGKVCRGTAVKRGVGRMKLHYGGTPTQAQNYVFAERGVDWILSADGRLAFRVGKKQSGSLLDGREWKEFPETP